MTRTHGGVSRIVRGRVYGAELGALPEKYYLAVSNNQRNHVLDSFLAVRLTTSPKPSLDTIVELGAADAPWTGHVLCDDLVTVYRDEVTRDMGALRQATMSKVNQALRNALAL
ncbi:type II toxin-antitoxin system PemK/MazF family toxin [Kutzneria buriramensis]|uniref:mRNA interferase MazF n=1 Tax=Kutzneria buriramensis TaxID=1045776 RepID=A0A3E0HCP2_9PSEU|nr:type II toxin-antitoxin system PemK/MazF family toxin [Kutzneria buriramensis]REH42618.1 mRNA interferase MazF [Kutzneria buriramensis]